MTDVLVFVEDAGSANLVRGLNAVTLATGSAAKQLAEWHQPHSVVSSDSSAQAILDQYQPRVLAVGSAENRDSLALSLVATAQNRGLPTVGLVDAYPNAGWRWRGREESPLAYVPDWLVVADEPTKAAYMALGVEADRVRVIGYVHSDYIAAAREKLQRRRPTAHRPVVVFVAEQFTSIDPAHSYQESIEKALEAVLTALPSITPRPSLVVRLHPENNRVDFTRYKNKIDKLSYRGDALPVVYSGDVIIGRTSTLLFEAALLGRPTISFLPCREEHTWLPSIAAGVTRVATTPAELRQQISDILHGRWQPSLPTEAWAKVGARQQLTDFLRSLV